MSFASVPQSLRASTSKHCPVWFSCSKGNSARCRFTLLWLIWTRTLWIPGDANVLRLPRTLVHCDLLRRAACLCCTLFLASPRDLKFRLGPAELASYCQSWLSTFNDANDAHRDVQPARCTQSCSRSSKLLDQCEQHHGCCCDGCERVIRHSRIVGVECSQIISWLQGSNLWNPGARRDVRSNVARRCLYLRCDHICGSVCVAELFRSTHNLDMVRAEVKCASLGRPEPERPCADERTGEKKT